MRMKLENVNWQISKKNGKMPFQDLEKILVHFEGIFSKFPEGQVTMYHMKKSQNVPN